MDKIALKEFFQKIIEIRFYNYMYIYLSKYMTMRTSRNIQG